MSSSSPSSDATDIPDGAMVGRETGGIGGKAPGRVPGRVPGKVAGKVSAGFGSPSADSTVKRIDLNDAFIRHPEATYVMRAAGDAMRDAGIDSGDVLLVDRAINPAHGHVVIAIVDGELICRRLWKQEDRGRIHVRLQSAHPEHRDITIGADDEIEVWGVVTTVVKSLLD